MGLKRLFLGAVLVLIFTPISNTFADVQDFYFEDFTADYYLTKLEDGTSNLHVKEVLTAIFPETNQNHGITRSIPVNNQDGSNRVVQNQAALNLTVLRNGVPETIGKIEDLSEYYLVYIGSASEYVHGRQVYTLEYDYTDVITEFDENGINVSGLDGFKKVLQELYWDANGTDWKQSFGKVTANLHVSADIYEKMDKNAWCYVGMYGEKGNNRCEITLNEDGFSFTAVDLDKHENLTFVVEFDPDTFDVALEKNYILVVILVAEGLLVAISLMRRYLKWRKLAKAQYDLYKSLFTAPQYQPPEDKSIHVAEGEQIYIKRTDSSYVATLLELAVDKKVTIKKVTNEKYDWAVVLNVEPDELSGPQKQMMNILSGNVGLAKGDELPVKKHEATKYLMNCAKKYWSTTQDTLREKGYFKKPEQKSDMDINKLAIKLIVVILCLPLLLFLAVWVHDDLLPKLNSPVILVGAKYIPIVIAALLAIWIVISSIISGSTNKYKKYTEKGIRLAKYLEGLELYINMAEADRLKFLQSIEGADTSEAGIVKLYEKLLPWASLFGAEESWAKELEKYYEIENVESTLDINVVDGIIASNIAHDITRAIFSSTSYTAPSSSSSSSGWSSGGSGGSWSSSSSGGGSFGGGSSGGGFSGGGGGGGGGGGW